jgi:hypothetical protein
MSLPPAYLLVPELVASASITDLNMGAAPDYPDRAGHVHDSRSNAGAILNLVDYDIAYLPARQRSNCPSALTF